MPHLIYDDVIPLAGDSGNLLAFLRRTKQPDDVQHNRQHLIFIELTGILMNLLTNFQPGINHIPGHFF